MLDFLICLINKKIVNLTNGAKMECVHSIPKDMLAIAPAAPNKSNVISTCKNAICGNKS